MSVSFEGGEWSQLAGDLSGQAPQRIRQSASKVVRKSTLDTERDGKALAPVDTGFLVNSIGSEFSGNASVIQGETGPTAEYGDYVESGTSVMAPQPYMIPAQDRNTPGFISGLESIGGELL